MSLGRLLEPIGFAGPGGVNRALANLIARSDEFGSVFQSIVSVADGQVLGYEALLRLPERSGFAGAAEAFTLASHDPLLVDLELAALEAHLRSARGLPDVRLFLNLSASAFLDPRFDAAAFADRVRSAGYAPERIVLEISELVNVPDPSRFADLVAPWRDEHFHLAVDDFGAGFANVRLLVELGPDFVKIDRSLVTGAWRHPRKRVFLETLGAMGRRINCSVIAEGVETEHDLVTIRACGIPAAQGYLLGMPEPAAGLAVDVTPRLGFSHPLQDLPEERIGVLTAPRDSVEPCARVGELIRLFERQPEPAAIAVVDGGRVVGLVTQTVLFSHLGHRYGHALWSGRPVSEFVAAHSEGFDSLDTMATVENAAALVKRRPAWRRFDPLVVLDESGGYHGLLPVDLLLTEMTRLKVEYALQSNPLTSLPGSAVFARAAQRRMTLGRDFALGWADLDNFKPFNDRYGFGRGDSALLLAAETLREHLALGSDDLLAHPGGDDFAFLAGVEDVEQRAKRAATAFSERVQAFYDADDRRAGGILSIDRRGARRRFGFTSLSIGIVLWRGEADIDYRRIVEVAAEVKAAAKKVPGPAVFVNARALGERAIEKSRAD